MSSTPRYRGPVRNVPVDIDRGDLFQFFYTARNPETRVPLDLTGCTVEWKFFAEPNGALLLDATQYVVLGGAAGTVNGEIPQAIVDAWQWRQAYYVLRVREASARLIARLYGDVRVL